mmetsp:Transcript_80980/g.262321  ORF Transcript_80980/g.262321 Transcript_80980/m.262321 type:complete len:476 (+) Transcript_80980:1485-2912(+)
MELCRLLRSRSMSASTTLPRPWSPATRAIFACSSSSCETAVSSLSRATPISWQRPRARVSSSTSRAAAALRRASRACSWPWRPWRTCSARCRSSPRAPASRACCMAMRSICASGGSWKSAARRAVAARACFTPCGGVRGLTGSAPSSLGEAAAGCGVLRASEACSSVSNRLRACTRLISLSPPWRSHSSTADLSRPALPLARAIFNSAMRRFFSPTAASLPSASATTSRKSCSWRASALPVPQPAACACSRARRSCNAPPLETAARSPPTMLASSSRKTCLAFSRTPTPVRLSGKSRAWIPAAIACSMAQRRGWIMRHSMARTRPRLARCLLMSITKRSSALASNMGSTSACRARSMAMDSSSVLASSRARTLLRPSRGLVRRSTGPVPKRMSWVSARGSSREAQVLADAGGDSVRSMTSSTSAGAGDFERERFCARRILEATDMSLEHFSACSPARVPRSAPRAPRKAAARARV